MVPADAAAARAAVDRRCLAAAVAARPPLVLVGAVASVAAGAAAAAAAAAAVAADAAVAALAGGAGAAVEHRPTRCGRRSERAAAEGPGGRRRRRSRRRRRRRRRRLASAGEGLAEAGRAAAAAAAAGAGRARDARVAVGAVHVAPAFAVVKPAGWSRAARLPKSVAAFRAALGRRPSAFCVPPEPPPPPPATGAGPPVLPGPPKRGTARAAGAARQPAGCHPRRRASGRTRC